MKVDAKKAAIGAKIKAVRMKQDISQSEVARRSGVAPATMQRIEAGTLNFTIETLFAICDALDVSIHSLFTGEKPSAWEAMEVIYETMEKNIPKQSGYRARRRFEIPPDIMLELEKHPDFLDIAWDGARAMLKLAPKKSD